MPVSDTDVLTPLDATFLELEDADASAHMHIGAILVFDPIRGHRPGIDEVRRHVAARLPLLPRYRQRLSADHVGRFSRPHWEPMPDLDAARQVRHATLPAPGAWEDLLEWAEDFYAQRLDRTGPLWEIVLVDGLAGGHWALCTKTHHCLVDGVGSVDAAQLLLDAEAHPKRHVAPPAPEPAAPHDTPGLWSLPVRAVGAGIELARHPGHVGDVLQRAVAAVDVLAKDELSGAPMTSLNRPIGGHRRLRGVRTDLADVRATARHLGGTVNDVVLAAVAGGLRELLLARGEELPERGLRAMVPVNVRAAGEEHALGNRVTSLFVDLPVADPSALSRHQVICDRTAALKRSDDALGSDTIVKLAGLTPPLVHAAVSRSLFGKRLFNVTVTNVPGPAIPLYALGARLRSVYPLVPLAAEHALGVSVVSYDGRLSFGLNADRDTVPDLDVFAEGVAAALNELQRFVPDVPTREVSTNEADPS